MGGDRAAGTDMARDFSRNRTR
ncbi:MAG: hypothetical protein JWQ86_1082, partial [Mycobacterium sp.]|nr:hypothetical protein [Mycobacterium sp.]